MAEDVVVSVAEVRALANKLCDAIEARGQTLVRVQQRAYWTVYFEDMFDQKEPDPVVGDIVDDLSDARADLLETKTLPNIWHAAHHVAGLVSLLAYADSRDKLV
jgi:hypothetical protein